MKKLITNTLLGLAVALFGFLAVPNVAFADCPGGNTSQGQVLDGIGQTGSNCDDSQVTRTIKAVINIFSIVVGIAGVIMVIVGGFKYITSGGDASKVTSAKHTLIYALVGLAIAALAQFLVHFALSSAAGAACPSGQHIDTHDTTGTKCIDN